MSLKLNIILLGSMGSGKTSTGKELSRILDFNFMDTDAWIEEKNGRPVSEIFRVSGEAFFRGQESLAVDELRQKDRWVVATGGGIWMDSFNRKKLLECGWCVWLKVSAPTAFSRVSVNLEQRPLLAGAADPGKTLEELIARREPFYSLAHASFDSNGKTPGEVAQDIVREIRTRRPLGPTVPAD